MILVFPQLPSEFIVPARTVTSTVSPKKDECIIIVLTHQILCTFANIMLTFFLEINVGFGLTFVFMRGRHSYGSKRMHYINSKIGVNWDYLQTQGKLQSVMQIYLPRRNLLECFDVIVF